MSYDVERAASRQISYNQASAGMVAAFAKWTSVSCPDHGTISAAPSIDVRDMGPVDCGRVQYNSAGPNQHVIVFRDDAWPYDDINNTLALTTVTFDPETGEIYDADMEINTAQQVLTIGDNVPAGGYDFQSIVTHESGHFLGMAHSGDPHATMYAHYQPGSTVMRALTADDTAGICQIYAPNGTRNVGAVVSLDATIPEGACDPTPRHGFATTCSAPKKSSCSLSPGAAAGGGTAGLGWLFTTVLSLSVAIGRRVRRRARVGRR